VLDALERMFPAVRAAYMDSRSMAIAADAEAYLTRYRAESQAVRDLEAERRWKGAPLDESEVRRVASFLKSHNEMMKGEEFVMREMRNRAREVRRLWIAAVFLLFALALFVRPPAPRAVHRENRRAL
jgi:hypothetical protein